MAGIRTSGAAGDTDYIFSIGAGGGSSKSGVSNVVSGFPLPPDELRRGFWSWYTDRNYGASALTEEILGHWDHRIFSGSINEGISLSQTCNNVNGMHVWIEVLTITTFESGTIVLSGESIDEKGKVTAADTETITITNTTNKFYTSSKRWNGNVVIDGDNPGSGTMSIVIDAGAVDPFNHYGMMRVFEGWKIKFLPDSPIWSLQIEVSKWSNGTTGGLNHISFSPATGSPRPFASTDVTPRSQSLEYGIDWNAQVNAAIDPDDNEGIIVRLVIVHCARLYFDCSFYEY